MHGCTLCSDPAWTRTWAGMRKYTSMWVSSEFSSTVSFRQPWLLKCALLGTRKGRRGHTIMSWDSKKNTSCAFRATVWISSFPMLRRDQSMHQTAHAIHDTLARSMLAIWRKWPSWTREKRPVRFVGCEQENRSHKFDAFSWALHVSRQLLSHRSTPMNVFDVNQCKYCAWLTSSSVFAHGSAHRVSSLGRGIFARSYQR